MALGPIRSTVEQPQGFRVAEWLTPARGWWLGIGLLAMSLIYHTVVFQALWALGGQELMSSLPVTVLTSLVGVGVPLGAAFAVASVVAARIRRIGFAGATTVTIAPANERPLPPRLSPRVAVLTGTAMILVGLIDQSVVFAQYLPQHTSIERDVVSLFLPFLAFLLPVGVPLIATGWLLGLLDNRTARPRKP